MHAHTLAVINPPLIPMLVVVDSQRHGVEVVIEDEARRPAVADVVEGVLAVREVDAGADELDVVCAEVAGDGDGAGGFAGAGAAAPALGVAAVAEGGGLRRRLGVVSVLEGKRAEE